MATKEMYLVFTRFYKGEDECPEVLKSHQSLICQSAWKMESLWVREMVEKGQISSKYSYSYHNDGLSDFSKNDGVPQSLKEFFYGYGLHRAEGMLTTDEFKKWYYQYLSSAMHIRNSENSINCTLSSDIKKMEKRQLSELLPLCKFYCGGEKPPAHLKSGQVEFYLWEQEWVRFMLNGMDDEFDSENILYYTHYVTPLMSDLHDAPLSLMAYMFVRSGKYSFSLQDHAPWFVEQVQKWYK